MAKFKYFNALDLTIIKNMSDTLEKMDMTLDVLNKYYAENFGQAPNKTGRLAAVVNKLYVNKQNFMEGKKKKFDISWGFFWDYEDDTLPLIGVRIFIPTYGRDYATNPYFGVFSMELKSWIDLFDIETYEAGIVITNYKDMSEFMTSSENIDQLADIANHFAFEFLEPLIKIKAEYPDLFTNEKALYDTI